MPSFPPLQSPKPDPPPPASASVRDGSRGGEDPRPPENTFLWIAVPMLTTVVLLRLFLHLVRVQHVYPGGFLVHHLFTGVLLVIPSAFVIAFGTRHRWLRCTALAVLGGGSGMVLDEIVFLVMTKASDGDYVSRLSLLGAAGFLLAALLLLWILHRSQRR